MLVGRVADHGHMAAVQDRLLTVGIVVHHEAGSLEIPDPPGHRLADQAEADDDDVAVQVASHAPASGSTNMGDCLSGCEQVGEGGRSVDEGAESGDDNPHREDPANGIQRVDLAVADGAQGDDGHVGGVDPPVPLQDDVAARRDAEQDEQREQRPSEPMQNQLGQRSILEWALKPGAKPPHDRSEPGGRGAAWRRPTGAILAPRPCRGTKPARARTGLQGAGVMREVGRPGVDPGTLGLRGPCSPN